MATVVDRSGNAPIGNKEVHIPSARTSKFFAQLLSAATSTGSAVANIPGGDYIWSVDATTWNGATATLQMLNLDGVTWSNVTKTDGATAVSATAKASIGIGLGQKATLRVAISGTPTGVNSNIAGL